MHIVVGVSSAGTDRPGFAYITSNVDFGRLGIMFRPEVSRLTRDDVDWYPLIDACELTDKLVAGVLLWGYKNMD